MFIECLNSGLESLNVTSTKHLRWSSSFTVARSCSCMPFRRWKPRVLWANYLTNLAGLNALREKEILRGVLVQVCSFVLSQRFERGLLHHGVGLQLYEGQHRWVYLLQALILI